MSLLETGLLVGAAYLVYKFAKLYYYDYFGWGGQNLLSTKDVQEFRVMKRLMLPAFTPNALAELEPMIHASGVEKLMRIIGEHADAGDAVDLMALFKKMTFDIIGEVGFGKSFGLLDEKDGAHDIVHWIDDAFNLGIRKLIYGKLYHPMFFGKLVKSEQELIKASSHAVLSSPPC
ncbi:hypothetical protein SYNPS1DRAFT_25883 [Syncephalis pseudoplumigaleata]|uniref:Cytochrome P450 n=1 Tax=Syncephalis pseudoplumigaleata TaxID=1712513 RepID=A0A4P9YSP5_9FUNG|nr:hypothetical protein SYNPS1DRAFT_25883 [Syncephalis pseudoplumigaleata]|eukprot:RKP22392.1 hypothetical protein SYNPS1DRAFT_25883 [Syncephalis pseudoplumigaleata]